MTAKEFLDQFGIPGLPKENCLIDVACPYCGDRDGILVNVQKWTHIYDDGTDDDADDITNHDTEYDEKSSAQCTQCGKYANFGEFEIPGLDEEIERQLNE